MPDGLNANKQNFIGKIVLFEAFHALSKREIFEYSLSIIIQTGCDMFPFCKSSL